MHELPCRQEVNDLVKLPTGSNGLHVSCHLGCMHRIGVATEEATEVSLMGILQESASAAFSRALASAQAFRMEAHR
jgi:hypothetical protein